MKDLFLIKPIEKDSNYPSKLDADRCIYNFARKIETCICLDLNILSEIRKFMERQEDRKISARISAIINLMRSLPLVYLEPGLALQEIHSDFRTPTRNAFDNFCDQYLGSVDASDCTRTKLSKKSAPKFPDWDELDKRTLSTLYFSILLMHYIKKEHSEESGCSQFKHFYNTLLSELNIIEGLGGMIAALYFTKDVQADQLKKIKNNFLKKSARGEVILKNARNAASDGRFLRCASFLEFNSHKTKDYWILTADKGLAALAEIMTYTNQGETCIKFPDYLNKSKDFSLNINYKLAVQATRLFFNKVNKSPSNETLSRAKKSIEKLENYFLYGSPAKLETTNYL